ncbi:MAG: P-II family nitrogen regulator [Clostridiales Family XIII bacterium]|nr:P-II family nitrogen regulator [Clostridiales Family XIII bacterium]
MADFEGVKYNLIVTIVSRGYADIVIGAAKESGARGGTVLYARGSGIHETEKFLNISIQPEKEVVLTLVKKEVVKEVVSAITEKAGLTKAGQGISFVLPVTRTAGIISDDAQV